jgi:hypothetical protein
MLDAHAVTPSVSIPAAQLVDSVQLVQVRPLLLSEQEMLVANASAGAGDGVTRDEHRSMALLEAKGYACTRAAASLGIDIASIERNPPRIIPATRNKSADKSHAGGRGHDRLEVQQSGRSAEA